VSLFNCVTCGQLFAQERNSQEICLDCFGSQEQEFQVCKNHLKTNSGITLQDLSKDTRIPIKKIMSWIREGRIRMS
jgi:hypothetical protein